MSNYLLELGWQRAPSVKNIETRNSARRKVASSNVILIYNCYISEEELGKGWFCNYGTCIFYNGFSCIQFEKKKAHCVTYSIFHMEPFSCTGLF